MSQLPPPTGNRLDYETLRALMWLLLHRHQGVIKLDRTDLLRAPPLGEIIIEDAPNSITITARK